MIYTDPKLAPGGAGPGDAPEPQPTVSAYTGMGDVVPPPGPGWGPPPGPPGLYGQGEVPAIPSPALYPGAPIPGPPTIIPGSSQTTNVDGLLLPQTAAPAAPPPPGPPLPAEAGAPS
jgi:hypothetical protein